MSGRAIGAAVLSLAVAGLAACGGGGSSLSTPTVVPTPVPSAAVTAVGAGYVVIHPSRFSTWAYALATPIRIRETGGGRAKWNYARVSIVRGGREIERAEIGSDILASPPDWTNIAPSSDGSFSLVFRLNSSNFERVDITLGFTDVNSGRQFVVDVPFGSFSGVDVSFVALNVPEGGQVRSLQ